MLIYRLTNRNNGKQYVGQTTGCIHRRLRDHRSAYSAKRMLIAQAIQKHGWQSFMIEVLQTCLSQDALDEAEREWIAISDCMVPKGYNRTSGGSKRGVVSQETRQKMSRALRGKVRSEETRARISAGKTGKKRRSPSVETRRKQSDSLRGITRSHDTRRKIGTALSKFSPNEQLEMRTRYSAGERPVDLIREYGCSKSTFFKIVRATS